MFKFGVRHFSGLVLIFAGALGGCRESPTAPFADIEQGVAAKEANDRMMFVGTSLVDRRTGKSFPAPPGMKEIYDQAQEAQRKYEKLKQRLDRDPRMRATSLRAQAGMLNLDVAQARVARLLGDASGDNIVVPSNAAMTGLCDEMSRAIYQANTTYKAQVQMAGHYGDEFMEQLAIGNVGGAFVAFSAWRQTNIDIVFSQVQLGVLADLYGAYGCWD